MIKFITTTALVAASAALAGAATVDLGDIVGTDSSTFLSKSDFSSSSDINTTLGGYTNDGTKVVGATTASDVATYLSQNTGVYYGVGTLNNTTTAAPVTEISNNTYGGSIYIGTRTNYLGQFTAVVASVSDILGESYTDLSELSISYTSTATGAPSLTVWVIADGTATQIDLTTTESNQQYTTSTTESDDGTTEEVTVLSSVDVSTTVSLAGVVTEESTIVVLFNAYAGAGTVTGLSISAAVSEIPEPSAFGLLAGLGAIAFLASRRRRTK